MTAPRDVINWLCEGNSEEDLAEQLWEKMTQAEKDEILKEMEDDDH